MTKTQQTMVFAAAGVAAWLIIYAGVKSQARADTGDGGSAMWVCKDIVAGKLSDPDPVWDYIDEHRVSEVSPGNFAGTLTVRARNGFGGYERVRMRCEMHYLGNKKYRLIKLKVLD